MLRSLLINFVKLNPPLAHSSVNRVFDLAKSKFRYVVHLYNNRGHHKAADSYVLSWLRTWLG